jgi:hypothetical protein
MTNRKKFLNLVDVTLTDTLERNRQRIQNRENIRYSQEILIVLLEKIEENNFRNQDIAKMCECELSYLEDLLHGRIINVEHLQNIYDIVKMHSQPI